jgi:hypothetical protein
MMTKLRDLKGKFGTHFCFMEDVICHAKNTNDHKGVFNTTFFIAEDNRNNERITMIQSNMRGGFLSYDEGSSIWDDEVIVFNS